MFAHIALKFGGVRIAKSRIDAANGADRISDQIIEHNVDEMLRAHLLIDLHCSLHGIQKNIQHLLTKVMKFDATRIENLQMRDDAGEGRDNLARISVQSDNTGVGKDLEQHREEVSM